MANAGREESVVAHFFTLLPTKKTIGLFIFYLYIFEKAQHVRVHKYYYYCYLKSVKLKKLIYIIYSITLLPILLNHIVIVHSKKIIILINYSSGIASYKRAESRTI